MDRETCNGRRWRRSHRHCGTRLTCALKRSTALALPLLLLAPPASADTITIASGGTVTTTLHDTYTDNTGNGGGFTLTANTGGDNDSIAIQSAAINQVLSGNAINISASTGSYSVTLHDSTLKGTGFSASTTAGRITLDTTGGWPNTVSSINLGVFGFQTSASISANIGADTIGGISVGATMMDSFFQADVSTSGTTIMRDSGYGIRVYAGDGGVTTISANSGLISIPNGTGIYAKSDFVTDITIGKNQTIVAQRGVFIDTMVQMAPQNYPFHYNTGSIVSYGTIIANGGPAIEIFCKGDITLGAESRTVGAVRSGSYAAININIDSGADISGTTFESKAGLASAIYLKGTGTASFDIGKTANFNTIQKNDTGTWAITNSGSASGIAFTVNAGTLTISADNDLGSSSTLALKNGTTFGFTAGGTFTHPVTVEGDPTFDTMGNTVTYNGLISDGSIPGDVEVTGGGTLTLNAANTYSGMTTVTGGRLLVGDASHPGASIGDVTVASGGTLSGFGIVTGTVTNNGTVATGLADGALTLGGLTQSLSGTLAVELLPSSPRLDVTGAASLDGTLDVTAVSGAPNVYTVLTAGSISGTFADVTAGNPGMVYGVLYAPQSVSIVVAPETVAQIYGDLRLAMLDTAFAINGVVMDKLASDTCPSCTGWSVWAHGLLSTAHTDSNGSASAFNNNLAGVIGGIGYCFGNGMSAQAVFAYGQSDLKPSGLSEKVTTDNFYVSLAGHAPVAGFMLDASAFYIDNSSELTRDTQYAGNATAKPDSSVFGFALQAGLPLLNGEVIPTARLSYAALDQSAVSETGGGIMALTLASAETTQLRSDIGVRLTRRFVTGGGTVLVPELRLFLDQALTMPSDTVEARFSDAAELFQSPAAKGDRTAALVGAGLTGEIGGGWELSAAIDSRLGSRQSEVTGSFGARWHF